MYRTKWHWTSNFWGLYSDEKLKNRFENDDYFSLWCW